MSFPATLDAIRTSIARQAAWSLTVLLTTCLFQGGCQSSPNESVKIATFNTFLRSPQMYCLASPENFLDCVVQYDGVPEANAIPIAIELLQGDYDIVALNEVFDEDARAILVSLLSAKYPHYVERITDADFIVEIDPQNQEVESIKINGEDSGLMLFSRFPFLPLPNPIHRWDPQFLYATTPEVAFIRFDAYADDDQFAAKGVGLVRVRNPQSGNIYTIAFTHMQADYDPDFYTQVRAKQFDDIERIITDSLGMASIQDQHVFVLGDLNVRGEGGVINGPSVTGGSSEWASRFGTGFFFNEMVDGWAATTSDADTGITNYHELQPTSDDQRLDYAAGTRTSLLSRFCFQHMTRRHVGNSDHFLVRAHHNISGPFCDPRRAWMNPPLDVKLNAQATPGIDSTKIDRKDGAQWYFFGNSALSSQTGERLSVSIAVNPNEEFDPATQAGVVFELYDPADLSTPIPQYYTETTDLEEILGRRAYGMVGKFYEVPDEFFIKVFSPNPQWTGNYELLVHKHECQSPEDRCILYPNRLPRKVANWKAGSIVGPDDEMWYQVDIVDVPDSGGPQHIRAFAGSYQNNVFKARLVSKANPNLPMALPPLTQDTPSLQEFEGDITGPQSMLMVVKRSDPSVAEAFDVGWDTNLTVLHGEQNPAGGLVGPGMWREELRCEDETNPELGSDEIHLLISVDNGPWQEIFYHECECNDGGVFLNIEGQLGVRKYTTSLRAKLVEEDGSINPDDAGPIATINPLGLTEFTRPQQHIFWEFEDGRYTMTFNLSRTLQQ